MKSGSRRTTTLYEKLLGVLYSRFLLMRTECGFSNQIPSCPYKSSLKESVLFYSRSYDGYCDITPETV
ncbi:unnamed protein product [Larinioides sclopetarius]|uniref:Uncharacterized protein n=1 Tax=Larinioides sclopetarius TaxID=280406 RepID=A0AAV1Z8E3_9ARAC